MSSRMLKQQWPQSKLPRRAIIALCAWPLALVVAGVATEESSDWEPALTALRAGHATDSFRGTKLGRILDRMRRGDTEVVFSKLAPEEAPSSMDLDAAGLRHEPLALSLHVDEASLYDPETGILANSGERGREWERLAYVSFYRFGELVHASRIGLRRHGGAGRRSSNRLSWRFYFRGEYESDVGPTMDLIGFPAPIDRLVVRRTEPGIPNLLAFEIAERIGALAPAFAIARLVVNGDDRGTYLITEHVNPGGWGRSHFGDTDFAMFVYKGLRSTDSASLAEYQELENWVRSTPAPMSMEKAAQHVDLDNLVRHMMTFFFSGTLDWAQGAAVRDGTRPNAKWVFVHWDLDHSFRDPPGWRLPAIDTVLYGGRPGSRNSVRALLMARLIAEDPLFARYFVDLATDVLDHRLTDEFLSDLLDRYAHLLPPDRLDSLNEFFAHRHEVLRKELRDLLEPQR